MRRSVSIFDTIALWAMLALCFLLPFFFVPLSYVTVPQSKMLLLSVLLIVAGISWCAARFTTGSMRFVKSSVVVAALLLPLAYTVSALVSGWSSLSLVGGGVEQDTLVASVLAFYTLALAVLVFSETPKSSFTALRAFLLGTLVLAFMQLLHLLVPALPLSAALAGQTGNLVGNWHELGLVLGFGAYLGLALFDTVLGDGAWRYVFLALSVLSLLLLVAVDLADIWLALAVLALFSLAYQWYTRRPREPWLRRYGIWLSLAVVSVLLAFFGSVVWNVLPSALQVASAEIRPSWQGTFAIGKETLNRPAVLVFGAGPNTFTRQWSLYKPDSVNQTQFWNTDFNAGVGSIPTSLITLGIIGLLAWLAFIAALLWMFFFCLRKSERDPAGPTLTAVGIACLYLIAFHILYAPQVTLNMVTFLFVGLYIALAAEAGHLRTSQVRLSFSRLTGYLQIAAGLLAGIILLVAGLFALRVNLAELLVNRSIALYGSSQDIGKAVTLIQQALFIYRNDDRAHRAGVELGILELQNLAAASDPTSETTRVQLQNTLQDTIAHGLAAVSIDSGDYQNWLELASLYQNLAGGGVQGAYDNARTAYERALVANPKDPMVYFRLAQLDVLEKKEDAALADATSAIKLKPDFAAAYYLASQMYTSKNDLANAANAAAQAVKYAPDDKLGWYNAGVIAYAQGDWQNAAQNEEQALARDPQYANALYVLGLSYYGLQRTADSIAAFQALAKLDPSQTVVQQILSNLDAGLAPLQVASSTPQTAAPPKAK